ncbi:MAG: hypothetical protein UHU21_00255 [Lachnospiraceae bacterium]|nr:hypothetical protein [Lachnospiraceae bacterium]
MFCSEQAWNGDIRRWAGGLQQDAVDEAFNDVAVLFPEDEAAFAHMLPGIGPQVRPVELVEEKIFPVIPAVYPVFRDSEMKFTCR